MLMLGRSAVTEFLCWDVSQCVGPFGSEGVKVLVGLVVAWLAGVVTR